MATIENIGNRTSGWLIIQTIARSVVKHGMILLFLAQNKPSIAQTATIAKEKNNGIQVQLGAAHSRFVDQGYTNSSLLFTGTNILFGLTYDRETIKSYFAFSAIASAGQVQSKQSKLPSDFVYIHPAVQYLRKITDYQLFNKENTLLAGINLNSINYYLGNEPVFDNIDIFSMHGLYLDVRNRLIFTPKKSLRVTYSLPLIVYENRVLWNGGASTIDYTDREHILRTLTTRGSLTCFNVRNVQFKVDYIMCLSNSLNLEVQYRFFYLNSFKQAPIHMYSNDLLLALKFKF
jgi:hypothetical protein